MPYDPTTLLTDGQFRARVRAALWAALYEIATEREDVAGHDRRLTLARRIARGGADEVMDALARVVIGAPAFRAAAVSDTPAQAIAQSDYDAAVRAALGLFLE